MISNSQSKHGFNLLQHSCSGYDCQQEEPGANIIQGGLFDNDRNFSNTANIQGSVYDGCKRNLAADNFTDDCTHRQNCRVDNENFYKCSMHEIKEDMIRISELNNVYTIFGKRLTEVTSWVNGNVNDELIVRCYGTSVVRKIVNKVEGWRVDWVQRCCTRQPRRTLVNGSRGFLVFIVVCILIVSVTNQHRFSNLTSDQKMSFSNYDSTFWGKCVLLLSVSKGKIESLMQVVENM